MLAMRRGPGARVFAVCSLMVIMLVGGGSAAWRALAAAPPAAPPSIQPGDKAAQVARQGSPATPLDGLLNPDGTLKTNGGFDGSVDTRGWRMETALNGQPRFVRDAGAGRLAPQGDVNWDTRFDEGNGLSGLGFAMALIGTDVYAAGRFTSAGQVSANNVARWDGSAWSSLGTGTANGVDDDVIALVASGTNLYAGGRFLNAGGSLASRVAKWDGSAWSSLGTGTANGVNGDVYALAVNGNNVYVGGQFTQAGGASANNIAMWDGSAWSTLGSGPTNGVNATVWSMAADGGNIYVGGDFTAAGGSVASHIARWDGSAWSTLGVGTGDSVYAITPHGSDLYVGGVFMTAGGNPASRIARWNGSAWSALGAGLNSASYAITFGGSDMYVGGFFTSAGGSPAFYVARWDGSAWFPLGARGLSNSVHGIGVIGGDVYVDGFFTLAGNNVTSYHFGIWHNPNVTPTQTLTPTNTPTPCATCLTSTPTRTPTLTPTCFPGGSSYWAYAASLPAPLLDSAVTPLNGIVYSFSGVSTGAIVPTSYKYNPATNTWATIAPLPAAREEPSAVTDGTYIYILGGADTSGNVTNTMYRYDPVSNTYQTMAPYNVATWAQAAAYAGGFIYKIAGCATNCTSFLDSVERFGVTNNTWEVVASYPQQIGWLMATGYNGQVYAAGGINSADSTSTYRYNPVSNMWDDSSFADLPVGRWGSASDILNGTWILAGGYAPTAVSNTAVAYDFAANVWGDLPDLLGERARFGGASASGSFYTVGGRSSLGGFNGTSEVQKYTVSCVPFDPTRTPPPSTPTFTSTPTLTPCSTCTSTPIRTATWTRTPTPCIAQYAYATATGTIVPGTTDTGNHTDDGVTEITLPFQFSLYGELYNSADVSSNGNLQFAGTNAAFTNNCLPDDTLGPAIMPHWDDLRTDGTDCPDGCGIFTSVSGTAPNRIFNIEWRTIYFTGAGHTNFEIRLRETTNAFDIIIGTVDQGGTSATIGVEDVGNHFTQFECNSGVSNNLQIAFAVQGCGPTPTHTLVPFDPTPPPPLTRTPTFTPTCAAGPAWNIVFSPNIGSGADTLNAVATVSANDAWAVGSNVISPTNTTALIERWDGSAWNVVPAPDTGRITVLYGVSVVSANDVWAVGSNLTGTTTLPLILHWDGGTWNQAAVPPITSTNASLRSVAAISANDVWAVGSAFNDPAEQTLTMHWNGSTWSVVPSPGGGNFPDSTLAGVSGSGPNDVWAVGLNSLSFNDLTLILHWDGTAWTRVPSPSPGFEQNLLRAVTAISPTDAWAVGLCYCRRPYDALALHWNGANWTQVATPDLATSSQLSSVSATASNDVWAVGATGTNNPLAMHWNGSAWSVASTPSGIGNSGFYGIAARSATDVWAVGYQNGDSNFQTLTERYVPGPCATSTPTFTPTGTPACTISFSDVHPSDYFYAAVMYLACDGVISGYADGTFRPYNNTTRGQLCKIVVLAEGWTLNCPTPGHFTDVPPDNPFFCYIETAYSHQIISGYADGTFRPGNNVTRAQLCKIVVLAEGWADDCPTPGHFTDVPPDSPFFCYVERAYSHGIITGYDDGTFRPGNSATRGQICKIVYQAVTGP